MNNNLLVTDIYGLKNLLNEPLYLIKQEFTEVSLPETPLEALPEEAENKVFICEGKNLKNLVFLVFSENNEIPAIDKLLYTKTLSALKLTNDDVALCIASIEHIRSFELIAKEFDSQKVICFADSANYGPELLSIKTLNSTQLYFCPSLSELQLNQDLKVNWWNGLKSFIA